MAQSTAPRNGAVHLRADLPRELALSASLLADLRSSGALERVAEEFRVARKAGGFVGIDAVVFLLAFFAAGWRLGGLRGFAEVHRPFASVMGALVGRVRLMGQASLSRLLNVVTVRDARGLCQHLLREHVGALEVLRSPAVQTTDALGASWHVFDFDPNREVYRRRDLARADQRPEGSRRTEVLAAPGHRGRKRGEVVMTQGLLSHQGSGLWLDASVQVGNGDPREFLEGALGAAAACCEALDHPRCRALVRTDGEFRGVPSFTAAAASGMAFVSRLSRYDLLDAPDVRARLRASQWERVDDAGAGPVRIAADLGPVMLEAGEATLRADGTRFAPVEVRVIVSCYRCPERTSEKGRRGHRIGNDAVFEMFGAVGLDPAAWSAGDIVTAYYGRCGQENRFAQADRELGIDSTFSFQPGGHLLAITCALATWNWKIVQAVRKHPLPPPPPPGPRVTVVVESPPELATNDEQMQPPEQLPDPRGDAVAALDAALADAAVASALAKRGMCWNAAERVAEDACGQRWDLSGAAMDRTTPSLRFANLGGASERRRYFQISVPEPVLRPIEAAVKALRSARPRASIRHACSVPRQWRQRPSYELDAQPPGQPIEANGHAINWPLFLPAKARAQVDGVGAMDRVVVDAWVPQPETTPRHPLVAANIEELRRRRWSWAARLARMAASPGTAAQLTRFPAGPSILRLSG